MSGMNPWNQPPIIDPANVSFTGGVIDGSSLNNSSGIPVILAKWGIPLIHLSSGSVSAVGAITAITALPRAYPNAYCYFPANALATAIAAGWYYCTFSTTTAGTAFLNTYTSGIPTIPSSPTAVTDGKGAFTGATTEHVSISIPLAAGAMGANGALQIRSVTQYTNSAGTKTNRIRVGGVAGTTWWLDNGVTTQLYSYAYVDVANAASNSVQDLTAWMMRSNGTSVNAPVAGADNLANATTIDFTLSGNTATDNNIVESGLILLYSDGT